MNDNDPVSSERPIDFRPFLPLLGNINELQLDIVGFLAILGEGSILANAQVSSLSKWMFVPRLLPAPQALLRPNRPSRLEQSLGFVTGVYSGNDTGHVNHIGNLVIDAESMPEFAVRVVEIVRDPKAPEVKAKTAAPLTVVAGMGCFMSITLLALAVHFNDGAALSANILLSFLSTLIGFGNKWSLVLPTRKAKKGKIPPGDVVIRYPKGCFLVVKCEEEVARQLYFAPETINYLVENPQIYRLISLVGTMMLMFGVIFLGNARTESQISFAACYIALNAAYWIVAALPAKLHWETSMFRVKQHRFAHPDLNEDPKRFYARSDTFTQALYKVLVVTKHYAWVRQANAAPSTAAWDEWLQDATMAAQGVGSYTNKDGVVTWTIPEDFDPQHHLNELLAKHSKDQTQISSFAFPSRTSTKIAEESEEKAAAKRHSISQHREIPLTTGE